MKIYHQTALNMIQKNSLQIALIVMSVMAATFGIMNVFASLKDPLIIERGCESRIAAIQSVNQTKDEIESFIKVALSSRFDTVLKSDPAIYLTEILQIVRTQEQAELKNKGIDQRVIVRSVQFEHEKYLVEADRLIGVGHIRTAIPLNLVVKISSKIRSASNPYGLSLTSVDQIKDDSNGK